MIILFTHNDIDGYGCALVLQYYYGKENVTVIYTVPGAISSKVDKFIHSDKVKDYDKIFITDISVCNTLAEKIDKMGLDVTLLDHHKTAVKLNKFNWCHVEINEGDDLASGTSLTYNYLINNNQVPNKNLEIIVRAIQLYDTWMWKDKYDVQYPRDLNLLFDIYGGEKFVDNYLSRINDSNFQLINEFEEKLVEIEKDRMERVINSKLSQVIKTKLKVNKKEYTVGLCFADQYKNDIGHAICESDPTLDFVIMNTNLNTMSFRTCKDIDLTKISKRFGGGGHASAAGCAIDKNIRNKAIQYVLNKSRR